MFFCVFSFSFFFYFYAFWGGGCVFVSVGLLCLAVLPKYEIRLMLTGRTATQLFSSSA